MAKTQMLEYVIYLRDPALVASLQAQLNDARTNPKNTLRPIVLGPSGYGVLRAPYNPVGPGGAAVEFAIAANAYPPPLPVVEVGQAVPTTGAGYLSSPWFTSNNTFPRDVATFTRSTGWWIFGSSTKFYWYGRFAVAGVAPQAGAGVPANERVGFTERFFVASQDAPWNEDAQTTAGYPESIARFNAIASRTGEGLGARAAGDMNYVNALTRYYLPAASREVWHRLYIRPIVYGTLTTRFWRTTVAPLTLGGFSLGLTASGQLALYSEGSYTNPAGGTLLGSFGQTTLGQWTRLDVFTHINVAASQLTIEVRVNGTQLIQSNRVEYTGDPDRYWSRCDFGSAVNDTVSTHVYDLDDYVCARNPVTVDATIAAWNSATNYVTGNLVRSGSSTYRALTASTNQPPSGVATTYWELLADPIDLSGGQHLVRVVPDGLGSNTANWTGDFRVLRGRGYMQYTTSAQRMSSSVANALLEVTLPLATILDPHPLSLGWVAWRVMCCSMRGGSVDGTMGYQYGTDTPVMATVPQPTSVHRQWAMMGTLASSVTSPVKGGTLRLRHAKANDTTTGSCVNLSAVMNLVGNFGPEDQRPGQTALTYPLSAVVHLNEHPWSPWARQRNTFAPVILLGTTYVGNGTGQDLLLKLPPAWISIRPTGATPGSRWWPGMFAPHYGYYTNPAPNMFSFDRDPSFVPTGPDADQQQQYRVRIGGTGSGSEGVNAAGVTYQVIAFCDPAGRFCRGANGAFGAVAQPEVPLDDAAFVPEVGWFSWESVESTTYPDLSWKGSAHGASEIQTITDSSSALITNAVTFQTGKLIVGMGAVVSATNAYKIENLAAMLFRRTDGNNYPATILFLGSYVGDGASTRTITVVPPGGGRRPLWLVVQAHGNGAWPYHRDPSHVGTRSTGMGLGSESLTAITGGAPDAFIIGLALNSTGTLYNYFGFWGGTEACENGWSCNGEFIPVPSDSINIPPQDEPIVLQPEVPPPDGGGGDGGDGDGGGGERPGAIALAHARGRGPKIHVYGYAWRRPRS